MTPSHSWSAVAVKQFLTPHFCSEFECLLNIIDEVYVSYKRTGHYYLADLGKTCCMTILLFSRCVMFRQAEHTTPIISFLWGRTLFYLFFLLILTMRGPRENVFLDTQRG